jgi:hypothetical protein
VLLRERGNQNRRIIFTRKILARQRGRRRLARARGAKAEVDELKNTAGGVGGSWKSADFMVYMYKSCGVNCQSLNERLQVSVHEPQKFVTLIIL